MGNVPSWRLAAACDGDNAVFFFAPSHFERKPEKDLREGAARAICGGCPVQSDCLDYAIRNAEQHGIWGGMNELQRSHLRRRLARQAAGAGAA